jgi:hypothetical protein
MLESAPPVSEKPDKSSASPKVTSLKVRVQPFPVARPKFTKGDLQEGSEGN